MYSFDYNLQLMSAASPSFFFSSESMDYTKYEDSSTSNDEHSDDKMPVIVDVMTVNSGKSKRHSDVPLTSIIKYGPIIVRKRHTAAPTLATGRRSKYAIMEGEAAFRREVRRMKNREAAKNLKRARESVENQLKTQLNNLESKERELLVEIERLQEYKNNLETRWEQSKPRYEIISQTTAPSLVRTKQDFKTRLLTRSSLDNYCVYPPPQQHASPSQLQSLPEV